jgi:exonuclease SbcD
MKILITADWHIGKKLHNEDLSEDIQLFFDWLLTTIEQESIQYLLVAGDVFDHNHPSNESTRIYYQFLQKLNRLNCKAIIIAGNHDSPSFIDVPSELLTAFDIQVFGLFPGMDNVAKTFVPLQDEQGNTVAVVAAIPFLQDRFIRQVGEGEGAKEIAEKIKQGMKLVMSQIGEAVKKHYPQIPSIGMAHLHAQGTEVSEAEREIQIGNQEGVPAGDLEHFDYLALGHIHTGQSVIKGKIQYASSPISLGFSENKYHHKVIQLEVLQNTIRETFITVPKNRSLYQLAGTMDEIETQIKSLQNKYTLQALLDIKIQEKTFDSTIQDKLAAIKTELANTRNMKIVNTRIVFEDKAAQRFSTTFNAHELNELNPIKVVGELIPESTAEKEKQQLIELFSQIYADVNQA